MLQVVHIRRCIVTSNCRREVARISVAVECVVEGMFRTHLLQRHDEHRIADKSRSGENILLDWAKIVDCGDAPLTFLVCF